MNDCSLPDDTKLLKWWTNIIFKSPLPALFLGFREFKWGNADSPCDYEFLVDSLLSMKKARKITRPEVLLALDYRTQQENVLVVC